MWKNILITVAFISAIAFASSIDIKGPGATSGDPTFSHVLSTVICDPSSNWSGGACTGLVISSGQVYLQSAGNTGVQTDGQKLIMPNTQPIIYASAATTKFQITSNVSAANTNNTTQPMIEIIPQNALDATDMILAVRNSVGTNLLSLTQNQIVAVGPSPTISSGFGTSPSITASGYSSFTITVGNPTGASGVIGLPTAPNGWTCVCDDMTTYSTTVFKTRQTASSTTSCTIGNFNNTPASANWVAADVLRCTAWPN